MELLRRVGIPDPESAHGRHPSQLSGGLRQRAMIAMALSCNPDLLIADEPTTALDVTVQAQILTLLKELRAATGMAMLFISHDLALVTEIADRALVMYAVHACETAPVGELLRAPRHPYSAGLVAAAPRLGSGRAPRPIPGTVPPPWAVPAGCPFHERCPNAQADCRADRPALREHAPGHLVSCYHPTIAPELDGNG